MRKNYSFPGSQVQSTDKRGMIVDSLGPACRAAEERYSGARAFREVVLIEAYPESMVS